LAGTDIQDSQYSCAAYGHASRIWRIYFLETGDSIASKRSLGLISFGEDATCQQWSLEFEAPVTRYGGKAKLSHVKTLSLHSGKNIWSADATPDGSNRWLVATGGADGQIF